MNFWGNNISEPMALGCILLDGLLIKETRLQADYFSAYEHKLIFEAMKQAESKGNPVDFVTVTAALGRSLNNVGGVSYLQAIAGAVPSVHAFRSYESEVIEAYKVRRANDLAEQIKFQAATKADYEEIQRLTDKLNELENVGVEDDSNFRELLMSAFKEDQRVFEGLKGIDTGYPDLNNITGGLKDDELTIIAARPSVGKTAFALNLADTACQNGVHTLFFSLEMGSGPLIRRMISNVGRIDSKKFENPSKKFLPEDWENHAMAYGILERYPMHLYDTSGLTVRDIRARCRKVMKKHPNEKYLMIVDYLQLIHGDSRKDRHREIGEISQGLKELAKELHIPVVALAQLNRGVEQRQDKRPVLSDLRDSGEIEQAADLVAFLHRDDYYNPGEQGGTIEVIVAKHRNGPVGVAELAYIKEYNRFASLERRVTA